ncbi:hypothetical protein TOT_020000011 [Theileria orientalis strain Shintoku]|uniref:Uncharacterized protein n=1 Tax=Theileria orientalis strain Shintoku TaxID=869250 RepID=J4C7W3_THEOR|nr:hypothetical protein TOT_020000011 [Theileria orientalis strain Shintoku]PVC50559.1 hypothetical protein MACL_00002178 [Theileria orientalis]BAM39738.1 hypothetical protein TOT_020000011 [Theileria orientalis strain Shintoku]|eukprot:XP_009690039.1 hypothetical protein TOT_020000011 [Theileria orientalis strain Shintoku]
MSSLLYSKTLLVDKNKGVALLHTTHQTTEMRKYMVYRVQAGF